MRKLSELLAEIYLEPSTPMRFECFENKEDRINLFLYEVANFNIDFDTSYINKLIDSPNIKALNKSLDEMSEEITDPSIEFNINKNANY